MTAKLLREKYTRKFVGLNKYSRASAWMLFSFYVLQILASVGLGAMLLEIGFTLPSTLGMLALAVFIGTRMRGLNNIIHECSHASFSSDRADNARIGKLCAALLFNSFSDYRDEHLSHHAHLGDYDHDLDLQGIRDLKLHEPLSASVVFRHVVTPFLGRHLPYYLGLNMSARDGRRFQVMKFAILLAVVVFTALYPLTGLMFLVVPFVLVYSALNYWADCLDHAGIVSSGDDLTSSRNVIAPRLVRWLFFPRNDCFHLVHHLFPHVPARHLTATHDLLSKDAVYSAQPNAVRGPVEGAGDGLLFPAE
jgi:fatty acid desaturase